MIVFSREVRALAFLCVVVGTVMLGSLYSPVVARAFPFGGQVTDLIHCINAVTYVTLSAPTPGPYIWTPGTRTYDFGPPSHNGQWLLGLAGVPTICIVSIDLFSIDARPGWAIMMMGSSQ